MLSIQVVHTRLITGERNLKVLNLMKDVLFVFTRFQNVESLQ